MAVNDQVVTDQYAIYNGDCCEVMKTLPDGCVHMSIYSPPFAVETGGALYNYSSSPRDFSNSKTYSEFFEQYDYLLSELTRVTLPGRISAVHCMDVPLDGANICGYSDFPGDIIRLYRKHGWEMLPRICIWKEPLAVRNRTMSKALAHRTICEDSTQTNVAAGDYLIPFRRKGKNPVPVTHPTGLHRYAGEREIPAELKPMRGFAGKQTTNRFSHWIWRHYASCFWDDIRLSRMLPFDEAKDKDDERHQHPLQLDVIERSCVLWSNPGENVFTPFMGVGSEVAGAVALGRRGIGIELKESYFRQAKRNVADALNLVDPPEMEGACMFAEDEVEAAT
jgi:DNA modification methylase